MSIENIFNDLELIRRLEAGDLDNAGDDQAIASDPGPFSKLFRTTHGPLKKYFTKFGIDYGDSEDLFQELMLHLRKILKEGKYTYDPKVKFSTWLFRVAKYFALNYEIKRKREKIEFSYEEVDEWFNRANESDESIEFLERFIPPNFSLLSAINPLLEEEKVEEKRKKAEDEERNEVDRRRILLALSLIDERYRKFLLLRYEQGWGYTKIWRSNKITLKNGKPPKSRTTIINLESKALLELSWAYAIIVAMVEAPWATLRSKSC